MCDVTGGEFHVVNTMKALMGLMETVSTKLVPGFVANFEHIGNPQNINIPPCLHKLVYLK